MDNLSPALAALAARHEASLDKDFDALLAEVKQLAGHPPATGYEYRHNLGWDRTWMELDESQVDIVLERGHPVQRRRIMGGWEDYTGGQKLPEPEIGMFPVDAMAPRPETPHAERIFAASKDLFDAWSRGESWALEKPLHEAYVIFFLETISDAISDLCMRWDAAGRPGNFPDSLAVQEELKRIICLEDRP
ncbi:hypothetical protein [Paenarthrobacter sp. YJN-5]|uniref:hypothetical protein n=1 Tax=Paenarthrobacter sp. YJN-5 TaxID=2735316 RepID=UPI001D0C43CD|nr:hypothetical protein [Paenarthrobacter sp. YJN-5]